MATVDYDLDINKQAIIKPLVILRQGDFLLDTMRISANSYGIPLDLRNATVTFMGMTPAGDKIVDPENIKMIDPANGIFEYSFPSAAAGSVGEYTNAYFSVSYATGTSSTMDFRIQVISGVDITASEAGDYISVVNNMLTELQSMYDTNEERVRLGAQSAVASIASSATAAMSDWTAEVNSIASDAVATTSEALSLANSVSSSLASQMSQASSTASYMTSVADSGSSTASYYASQYDSFSGGMSSMADSLVGIISSALSEAESSLHSYGDNNFVNKAGDSMTGSLAVPSITLNGTTSEATVNGPITYQNELGLVTMTGSELGDVNIDTLRGSTIERTYHITGSATEWTFEGSVPLVLKMSDNADLKVEHWNNTGGTKQTLTWSNNIWERIYNPDSIGWTEWNPIQMTTYSINWTAFYRTNWLLIRSFNSVTLIGRTVDSWPSGVGSGEIIPDPFKLHSSKLPSGFDAYGGIATVGTNVANWSINPNTNTIWSVAGVGGGVNINMAYNTESPWVDYVIGAVTAQDLSADVSMLPNMDAQTLEG